MGYLHFQIGDGSSPRAKPSPRPFRGGILLATARHLGTLRQGQLKVCQGQKQLMLNDLQLLNVTREMLLPSIDESAKAIPPHFPNQAM